MSLLNDDKGDAWAIISFQFDASFSNSGQLVLQNLEQNIENFIQIAGTRNCKTVLICIQSENLKQFLLAQLG